ncbi:MAG TPA: prephenate dehydrogenase/arogenate dehydrogenase family protein, partial [Casimicrobiaceae bacterium]|nr:prephenate dehydrogenase/arogenate dehydrogenase family protein [Casimicrobiaceae bacterium]
MRIDKLAVIGVGLIGASCALAMRRAGAVREIVGIGRSQENLQRALRKGAIDRAVLLGDDWISEIRDADFVLVAIPVAQYRDTFATLATALSRDAVITDAGSTKQDVVRAARETLDGHLGRFVPAHPVAGSERSGAEAGDAALFVGRQVILTPLPETSASALSRVEAFWTACGARVARLDPARHDRVLAAVSHV